MIWFPLAVTTALCESGCDFWIKRNTQKQIDAELIAFSLRLFAAATLFPLLFFIPWPELSRKFWLAWALSSTINAGANLLYVKALEKSDLSLCTPMLLFTPLFMLLTSPLILGEFPNIFGIVGVLFIVSGTYFLNFSKHHKSWIQPIRILLGHRGPRYFLLIAFLWSISANIDKVGVQESSPIFWAFAIEFGIAIGLLPFLLKRRGFRASCAAIKKNARTLAPVGVLSGVGITLQMIAIQITLVAYVIAIKRMSTVFSVLWGHIFLRESGGKKRIIASIIMLLGALVIGLLGQ